MHENPRNHGSSNAGAGFQRTDFVSELFCCFVLDRTCRQCLSCHVSHTSISYHETRISRPLSFTVAIPPSHLSGLPTHTWHTHSQFANKCIDKIQGDGRKFPDRLKVILGHKYHHNHYMRSISTNYSLNPQQKVICFHIFLSLIVSSWRHGLQMANEADEVLLDEQPR